MMKPRLGDERERMRRINGDGSNNRQNLLKETFVEPSQLVLGQTIAFDDLDAIVGQLFAQRQPAVVLFVHELLGQIVDLLQLLCSGQPILRHFHDALIDLTDQTGSAHHVEFIQVAAGDRQEANAFQQRVIGIARLFEHTQVEAEPRQLAIDEAGRTLSVG